MFEDSLMESTGRLRTRSRWTAIGSLLLQAGVVALLLLLPAIYPQALPKQSLEFPLMAPPPPATAAPPPRARVTTAVQPAGSFVPAAQTEPHIRWNSHPSPDPAPEPEDASSARIGGVDGGTPESLQSVLPVPPPHPAVQLAPAKPLAVSRGVAAGMLIAPFRPEYPPIARAAGVQGTVIVAAVISRRGTIENARVVSGPPLLQRAALDAVAAARYRPYLLNGTPVEVETTISMVFSLDR